MTEWEVSWSLPLANQWTSSMNFIHAVDGTEARGNSVNEEIDRDCIFSEGQSPETLRRTATHYINLPGAKYSTRTAEKRPEIHRFTEPDLRKWHLPFRVFRVWLWRLADSQKKACPTDSPRKWCKLGLICSEILYKSSRFAHPLNPQDSSSLSSSTPLRTPSLGCASEGVGYRFPVLVQGHRAHAAPIANAKAAAGAVHGCGTPRAPETRRLHRWRGWWLRPSSRSSRKMWRGDSWIIMGEYKWRIVRKNWGISIWRNLMKLISKLVSKMPGVCQSIWKKESLAAVKHAEYHSWWKSVRLTELNLLSTSFYSTPHLRDSCSNHKAARHRV